MPVHSFILNYFMTKILFICHGNICRSPMAEMIFKNLVRKAGLENDFYVDSAATDYDEIGNGMHRGTLRVLQSHNVPYADHRARIVTREDYENFDFLVIMDSENERHLKQIVGSDVQDKIKYLMSFAGKNRDVADPWYTGNFDETWRDISEGCAALFEKITQK